MVSIEEMRAYKDAKINKELKEANALEEEIKDLEYTIKGMRDDVLKMIEYGNTAVECGLLPKFAKVDDLHLRQKDAVYTDGWNHYLGFVPMLPTYEGCKILGVGIRNGGACGYHDLYYDGYELAWIWRKDYNDNEYKYHSERYRNNLIKFIKDYDAWKQRVYDIVEKNAKEV